MKAPVVSLFISRAFALSSVLNEALTGDLSFCVYAVRLSVSALAAESKGSSFLQSTQETGLLSPLALSFG